MRAVRDHHSKIKETGAERKNEENTWCTWSSPCSDASTTVWMLSQLFKVRCQFIAKQWAPVKLSSEHSSILQQACDNLVEYEQTYEYPRTWCRLGSIQGEACDAILQITRDCLLARAIGVVLVFVEKAVHWRSDASCRNLNHMVINSEIECEPMNLQDRKVRQTWFSARQWTGHTHRNWLVYDLRNDHKYAAKCDKTRRNKTQHRKLLVNYGVSSISWS